MTACDPHRARRHLPPPRVAVITITANSPTVIVRSLCTPDGERVRDVFTCSSDATAIITKSARRSAIQCDNREVRVDGHACTTNHRQGVRAELHVALYGVQSTSLCTRVVACPTARICSKCAIRARRTRSRLTSRRQPARSRFADVPIGTTIPRDPQRHVLRIVSLRRSRSAPTTKMPVDRHPELAAENRRTT